MRTEIFLHIVVEHDADYEPGSKLVWYFPDDEERQPSVVTETMMAVPGERQGGSR